MPGQTFNNGVYRCNLVLDRIDEANFDATLKKQYKGEALLSVPLLILICIVYGEGYR